MHPQSLLPSLPPSLSEQLKRQTDELRSKIVKANCSTQFARIASELAKFRDLITGGIDGIDNDALSQLFRQAVSLTTYDAYEPFINKFFETPCKESAIINLLAPGIPDYMAASSSTSGGRMKAFPKYHNVTSPGPGSNMISGAMQKRTTLDVLHLLSYLLHVEDENSRPVKTLYFTGVSTVAARTRLNLHPDQDQDRMGTFLFDWAVPYATGFISKFHTFHLMHALFALCSRSLESITTLYTSTFVDMMHHLESAYDVVVECIANGTIPDLDLDGVADTRRYLEMNMVPDPERAAELRRLGPPSSQPGWCSLAWPNLRSIITVASGPFATLLPLTRRFLGPNVEIRSRVYRSSEAQIGLPYDPLEMNQYKLDTGSVMEFLDISKDDSIDSVVQLWEVELGRRYEVVLTTREGLWRYRLGDVIEIAGFDPTDGVPVIHFVERRNMALRFQWFTVTEKELSAAILSMVPNTTTQIVGWTAMVDHRRSPLTIGFFVELLGDQGPDLCLARDKVLDNLTRSVHFVALSTERGAFGKPTIQLVSPGTFSQFLQLRVEEGDGKNLAQMKVPAVVSKDTHIAWFSNRVVQEL